MTATVDEYVPDTAEGLSGIPEDQWLAAEDPPDEGGDSTGSPDGAGSQADPTAPDEAAPYGYTVDRKTGQRRPKAGPQGRKKEPPSGDELRAAGPVQNAPDVAPPDTPHGRRGRRVFEPPADDGTPDVAMPRAGVIAKGVNKLYRRAGKILRVMDYDIGMAVIECTRADPDAPADEAELTVGEAWENLCKANPRVRRLVLKWIAGGDITDLVMAHAPIGLALMMKPAVQRLIPFARLAESWFEPDEDSEEGDLRPEDLADMADVQNATVAQVAAKTPGNFSPQRIQLLAQKIADGSARDADFGDFPPEVVAKARDIAKAMHNRANRARNRAQRSGRR